MASLDARIGECRERWAAAPASRAFIQLADLLRQAGRCDEALDILEAGLARHPRAVGGLVTLARTLAAVGRPAPAAEVAGSVLELDPDNLVALELLGDEQRRRGDLVGAIGHYERLVQLEPGDRHWATVLADLREQRTAAAAAAAGDADGDSGFATLTLVELYLAQGYRQKAATMLRRLAADRPGDPEVQARLAELDPAGADSGPEPAPASAPGPSFRAAAEKREQSREQFAMWIERLRAERGATP